MSQNEIAEKPAGEVDEVHALIDEFAAAGEGGIGAPLAVVAFATAVAVAGAEEHEGPEGTSFEEFAGFLKGGVEAVVVADADTGSSFGGGGLEGAELGGVEGTGFFDEHVFAGPHGGEGNGGEGGVECGDDDCVDGGIGEDGGVVGGRSAAGHEGGEVGGASYVEIAGGAEQDAGNFSQGFSAFAADKAATDDGEANRFNSGLRHGRRGGLRGGRGDVESAQAPTSSAGFETCL
jgi:hypothetical protein